MSLDDYDYIIVGAGPVGCVIADQIATVLNCRCLIIEKRNHIAGNCYDSLHESGVLIHNYGPHYFRTNHKWLIDYLSRFTKWIEGNYIVQSHVNGKRYPFPINRKTIENFFSIKLTQDQAKEWLEHIREKIEQPKNLEEMILSQVGRQLYESFYLNYTLKQWGIHPRELEPSIGARIAVRFDDRVSYVDHTYQLTPAGGFTALFNKMISHPNISIMLNTDFNKIKNQLKPKKGLIYSGPIDEYFDHCFGCLPYRSLDFEFKVFNKDFTQPCVQINYPNENAYTRTVEIKHITRQQINKTVVSYEYPKAFGEPYYPIPNKQSQWLYQRYLKLAEAEKNVYFCGRMAQYRYLNTDEAIESAFNTFECLRKDFINNG